MDANFNKAIQTLKAALQDVMEVMSAILQLFLCQMPLYARTAGSQLYTQIPLESEVTRGTA